MIQYQGNCILTGHSAGGTSAQYFAKLFRARAVSFACPKMWSDPAPVFNHLRLFYQHDPVPMFPVGYSHSAMCDSVKIPDSDWLPDIHEHYLSSYIDALTQELKMRG